MPPNALEFGGRETFHVPAERLFARLTDLDQIAATIPDIVSSQRIDDRTLKCVVRPGFSFLRGTLAMTLQVVDLQPPEAATMDVVATGIGLSMRVQSVLHVTPILDGSQLDWKATVLELKGLIATLSRPLIAGAADQVIRNAWRQIHLSLDG